MCVLTQPPPKPPQPEDSESGDKEQIVIDMNPEPSRPNTPRAPLLENGSTPVSPRTSGTFRRTSSEQKGEEDPSNEQTVATNGEEKPSREEPSGKHLRFDSLVRFATYIPSA